MRPDAAANSRRKPGAANKIGIPSRGLRVCRLWANPLRDKKTKSGRTKNDDKLACQITFRSEGLGDVVA